MTNEQINPHLSGQINGLISASSHEPSNDECAHIVFEVVPQVMQHLRAETRRQRGPDLSVLQLRALAYLRRNPGATLSVLAEHVGLTLPSMSSQVSGLVARNLIDRSISPEDRRFVTLRLTEQGSLVLESARQGAQESLAKTLSVLTPHDRSVVVNAMLLLERVFNPTSTETPPVEASSQSTQV